MEKNAFPEIEQARSRIARIALGDFMHRSARRYGPRIALIDGARTITYADLDFLSNRFAHFLLGQGLQRGEKVAMLCANSIEMVAAFQGIYKAGLVWVPINTGIGVDAMRYIFEHAEIRHVVIDAELYQRADLAAMIRDVGAVPVVCEQEGAGNAHGASTFAQAVAGQLDTLPEVVIESDDLVHIMYTSGTTGRQKGVMHSHASIHAAVMSNLFEWGSRPGADVFSCILPMFHVGQHTVSMTALFGGGTLVLARSFDINALIDAIERHRMTVLVGLPMMHSALLNHPGRASRDLSSLRLCIYAMAPMAKTLLMRLIDEICPNYILCSGQTEVYTAATIFESEQQLKRFGSYWGVATIADELAVMGDDGSLLGPGQVGEIVYRGANVMLGYYKDPDATAHVQRHGWHHSGDLGMFDQDGQLLFLDRIKDMIKTGGENVPSIKVEEVLLRYPSVLSAAVVGLNHERWGEAITAFVKPRDGVALSVEELAQHCRQHLGNFEVPKSFIIVDSMPMTSTGKIQKFELRQQYLDHYAGMATQ